MNENDKRVTSEPNKMAKGQQVPMKFQNWFQVDRDHTVDWREEAKECYSFVAGDQWTDEEKAALKEKARPIVAFNRIGTVVDSIHGHEIGNRREVRYIPREIGDAQANELLTGAAMWFRDQSHADDHESDAFLDTIICGIGATETRIDYEASKDGSPSVCRIDPLEMYWNFDAKHRNLTDTTRRWRMRAIPYSEAKERWPGNSFADLDATWTSEYTIDHYDYDPDREAEDTATVNVVHVQWKETVSYYEVADPLTQQVVEMTEEEFKKSSDRLEKLLGLPLQGVKMRKKVIKQAFLGNKVLEVSDAPCPNKFSFQFMTGKRDRNKNTWYGVVRPMLDPQRWANKWLSQMMHIMNTNSKGGLLAERGAFDDQAQAEQSWSDPEAITWLQNGALAGKKVKEKSQATFPTGFQMLTEFAISSIRDTSGVSVEMLGMREANQAASLEAQRRQAGMTILQPFFDSIKHYREEQGGVMLHYIQEDLSDGRLIRIVGKENEQFVPLMKSASAEFDIIVDDAPTSPNQKELAWDMITQLLPVVGKNLPPEMIMSILEYSPLPSSIVSKLKAQAEKQAQQNAPIQQAQQQMEQMTAMAEVDKIKSEAEENRSEVERNQARTKLDRANLALSAIEQFNGQEDA